MPHPFQYVKPTDESVKKIEEVRQRCMDLHALILSSIPDCREKSVAVTNLEQVSMWANKAIVFTQK